MIKFKKQRVRIKDKIGLLRSLIHISFDLWTSPNSLRIIVVMAHFLDKKLNNRSLLIGIRRVRGSHSGENIAEAIIPVLVEIKVISKLGYFTTDNASTNNVTIKLILKRLRPNIRQPRARRVRYLGHIINLAAKAFLFNRDKDSFKNVETGNSVPITALEVEIEF
jgi:hypothetical protein